MKSRSLRSALSGSLSLAAVLATHGESDYATPYVFSHLAGPSGGYGNADGTGAAARFYNPAALAIDRAGNIYVADNLNAIIRKITPDGVVTTLLTAGGAQGSLAALNLQNIRFTGVAVDPNDDLIISDGVNSALLKLAKTGVLSRYTGQTGLVIYKFVNGAWTQAAFDGPMGLAYDAAGNLYVADSFNNVIRKITPQGDVSTFAGTPPEYGNPHGAGVAQTLYHRGSADGPAASAQFAGPIAVTVDSTGNVYVADSGNHTVRKITSGGDVTTLAGLAGQDGSTDGTGTTARFRFPSGVAVDATGNVFVADSGNGVIRKITPAGTVSTFAGVAGAFANVDGQGSAARFVSPKSVLFDRSGRLLVGDGTSIYGPLDQAGTIRRITADGTVTTLAGSGGANGSVDAKGEAARFRNPADVAVDAAGNVFVSDELNNTIRKITPDGTTTTFAGTAGLAGHADGPAGSASFNHPTGLAFDAAGQLFVADHNNHLIRRVAPDGFVTTVAGVAGVAGSLDGPVATAQFHNPVSVATDSSGTVYVGDGDYFPGSGDPARQFSTIRKISGSTVTTLAGNPQIVDSSLTRSLIDGVGADARFGDPTGLVADGNGNLFVADYTERRIRRVSTADGTTTSLNLVDGSGVSVPLHPFGLTRDQTGNLYVSDLATGVVHHVNLAGSVTPTTGVVTRLAGTAGVLGSADGVTAAVQFNQPSGLKIDAKGTLYVADSENHAIRRGVPGGIPVITTQPQSQSITAGAGVQFSVAATAVPAPTYQWYFNGSVYSGATTSTLSFANARSSDAGDYTVIVTNAVGNVTSAKASLTVTAAPAAPAPVSTGAGGGGAPSVWFLLSLGTLRLLRRFKRRPAGRA